MSTVINTDIKKNLVHSNLNVYVCMTVNVCVLVCVCLVGVLCSLSCVHCHVCILSFLPNVGGGEHDFWDKGNSG